jgi:L,D-transpeptidase ErfK/SrfK
MKKLKTGLEGAWHFLKSHYAVAAMATFVIVLPLAARLIVWHTQRNTRPPEGITPALLQSARDQISGEIRTLERELARKTPKSYYLVINSASNEFSLCRGGVLVRSGRCSTGSYILLKNGDQQQWMFKTPKGEFRIQGKTTSPVWKKPDWAFIEEGLPVPSSDHYTRYEYGVLGDYALSLGHGYLIHGTLYQRFLGLPVTHGCIRLNDSDLEVVYRALSLGSKVYIY